MTPPPVRRAFQNPLVRKVLGLERFRALSEAWSAESQEVLPRKLSALVAIPAVLICSLPAIAAFMSDNDGIDWPTLSIGVAATLAIVFRVRLGLPLFREQEWRRSMSLVHTAFAVGCIPLAIIVVLFPEALFQLHTTTTEATGGATAHAPGSWHIVRFVVIVAVWAGLTEEFTYRGMLVSVVRRAGIFPRQRGNDIFAIILGALLFSLSHFAQWGPLMSLALFGIGIGLGIAYIAIGERVLPLVLYHILFDALSLSFAFFSHKLT